LDIRQDSEFATGYGYPKTAFKWEPDTDLAIRNGFIDISRIWTFTLYVKVGRYVKLSVYEHDSLAQSGTTHSGSVYSAS